jgi:transcription initiation factor TFIIIB Brf1 subunit/transcription initiation factor TFIIB
LDIELFSKIKENNYVYRGNGKKGVLGACLFYACVMNHITKTPREIASVMEIEERFLSQGDRTVQELNEKGVISIPTILRPLTDYLDQYFPALGIPLKYRQFIIDIVERAEKKNIHILNDSRTTTKCIGAIFLLINRVKELKKISKDQIVKECNISKSTFIRYYNLLLMNYKILKPVFKKHRIPMPVSWKESNKDEKTDSIVVVPKKKPRKQIKKEQIKEEQIKEEQIKEEQIKEEQIKEQKEEPYKSTVPVSYEL